MQRFCKFDSVSVRAGVIIFLLVACIGSAAQGKPEFVQAVAFGTNTELGLNFMVNIYIEGYSTAQDYQVLLDAFNRGGNEAVIKALERMPNKGRIQTPETLGYEIKFIQQWATPSGRKIRIITNRTMGFLEVMEGTHSEEYRFSAVELELNTNDPGKNTGILIPVCRLRVDNENVLQTEAFRFPWRLGMVEWSK